MTLTTAYLLGRDLDAAYRSTIDGDHALADACLDSARERLERATKEGVKDHEADFVTEITATVERYAAQSAALKGNK